MGNGGGCISAGYRYNPLVRELLCRACLTCLIHPSGQCYMGNRRHGEIMFIKPVNVKAMLIIISIIVCLLISGCKDNSDQKSASSKSPDKPGFVLDFEQLTEPQVLKSELFPGSITIKQYHIGQSEPTTYHGRDMSKIVFYYVFFPDTEEWSLDSMDIHLKDGSVKSENCLKVWNVALGVTGGREGNPVSIEQHFKPK